jgi:hypothetical protein
VARPFLPRLAELFGDVPGFAVESSKSPCSAGEEDSGESEERDDVEYAIH